MFSNCSSSSSFSCFATILKWKCSPVNTECGVQKSAHTPSTHICFFPICLYCTAKHICNTQRLQREWELKLCKYCLSKCVCFLKNAVTVYGGKQIRKNEIKMHLPLLHLGGAQILPSCSAWMNLTKSYKLLVQLHPL